MISGQMRRHSVPKFAPGAKERMDQIFEKHRRRLASNVPHGTSVPEEAPLQVQQSAATDSPIPAAASSAVPPGPPDSPGGSAPGTTSQPAVNPLPALQFWKLLPDSQGEWRDITIRGHRFSLLKTEFEPRVFEYVTFVDGVDTGEFAKVRDAYAELQHRARELIP